MKALVLCGGMSQRYLLEKLRDRGITSVLADMNEKAPAVPYADRFFPVSTLDYEGIKQLAVQEQVDAVLSVCADQMLVVAARVSEELSLPCYLDYKTAQLVSNKEYMKRVFVEHGIPTSKHIIRDTIEKADIADMQFPLVVKPVDSYSSRGVKKVDSFDALASAFSEAASISRTGRVVVEEYAGGDELSVDLYVENGTAKILCIRVLDKIPEGKGFIICRGRYPAPLSDAVYHEIEIVGQTIADAFGLVDTPMLIQLKKDGDRISVIEFCARTGGGIKYRLLPKVSGFDVVEAVLDLTLGEKPHYSGEHLKKYIVDEFLYCRPGVLSHLEGFDDLLAEGIIDHYDQFKAPGHCFKDIRSSGDRVAYFSVVADTMEQLREKHRAAADRVKAIGTDGQDLIRHEIIHFEEY